MDECVVRPMRLLVSIHEEFRWMAGAECIGLTPRGGTDSLVHQRDFLMRLEIRDFRLVVAISELGTLTRAGQQLNLTQSALSHQLADLERRLGAALFERSGRRMIPNRLGARLASHGKELLERLGDVERDVFDAAARREAVLRIATECYTCYHWLPPVLQEFRKLHPSVDVEVVPSATTRPSRRWSPGGSISPSSVR